MKPTTDVCDQNEDALTNGDIKILPPIFKPFGQDNTFTGEIVTVKAFEDNSLVRKLLELEGNNKVLFVDGVGSLRCALLGGALGKLAETNNWAGIIIYGCVRDVDELINCKVGVWAIASNPRKSKKKNVGEVGEDINILNIIVKNGDFCIADNDGILILSNSLIV